MTELAERSRFDRVLKTIEEGTAPLSTRLVTRLSERFITPLEEVAKLPGTKVKLITPGGKKVTHEYIGEVLSSSERDVLFLPQLDHRYYDGGFDDVHPIVDSKPKAVKAYFVTDDPYGIGHVEYDDPSVKYAIYESPPARISILNDKVGVWDYAVTFDIRDKHLDPFLEEALSLFPSMEDPEDLASLTNWIYERIPYREYHKPDEIIATPSLGREIKDFGAVCRQISAVAMGVLELEGITCTPIYARSSEFKNSHLYLRIDSGLKDQTEPMVCDPTWNISGTYKDILTALRSRQSSLVYHLPERARSLPLIPEWGFSVA